ncbi:M1 family metallopeptidase [Niabella ginsengisoli]|uniref:M1 family metallopeptidase n=1 Tax=Niabella ginsengisoli TaxID=522298 RepID=A0ABS9SE41_9BACT|nr:M1 family metallopeptidase [Niabella ginsengisoli]MCH5596627.1 M1 family metallopeptidase [Niabella ginsengisoli]
MVKIFCKVVVLFFVVMLANNAAAQLGVEKKTFTREDSLRGSYGAGRVGWDVLRYDLTVKPDFPSKTISGNNIITFYDTGAKRMQVDMQEPMMIDSVVYEGKLLPIEREGNVFWVTFRDPNAMYKIKPGSRKIAVYFHGKPVEAKNAPWDGGWIWTKDEQGRDWATVACQGLGASVWYPCKDYQADEPDSGATLSMIVPDTLVGVGNGRLINSSKNGDGTSTWKWEVKSPINNYNIIPYIGKYVNFTDQMKGEKGLLDLSYWVLDYNLEKAKKQFAVVKPMIKCFESWMGPYPFYEDSYKLIDAPHLGMEHQSGVAYGNKYGMGYLGKDLSGSGWGLKFDFIIVHESGHEWFANNITSKDIADMWIHESFTNYSETMFVECEFGKKAGREYVIGTRKNVTNDIPIIGRYGVNEEGSGDMYYKGGNMLHTIRQIINNDVLFKNILRGLNREFYHQTVTTEQVEKYMIDKSGKDLSKIFDQYLRTIKIPELQFKIEGSQIAYKWANVVKGFNMPVKLINGKWLYPTESEKKISLSNAGGKELAVAPDFYITVKEIKF